MKIFLIPFALAIVVSSVIPAKGQATVFDFSTRKDYRQSKQGISFNGGDLSVNFNDGAYNFIPGCSFFSYLPPIDDFTYICNRGTTAFVQTNQVVDPFFRVPTPYLTVTSLAPARIIAPFMADSVKLVASSSSSFDKNLLRFNDASLTINYDLTQPNSQEYTLTRYNRNIVYKRNERSRMESDIKDGAYKFSVPRLNNSDQNIIISHTLYPMVEGLARKNNKTSGFYFSKIANNRWTKDGFAELGFLAPNTIEWQGITRNTVFPNADKLYISVREMSDSNNPKSDVARRDRSIFPAFQGVAGNPRINVPNVLTNKYTIPPILPSGTKGIVEVEYDREIPTGNITYDKSLRRFQIPFIIIDRYTDYSKSIFGKNKIKGILEDADGDGFNNLTEWILNSNPLQKAIIPVNPRPATVTQVDPFVFGFFGFFNTTSYYGFSVDQKIGTIPQVNYTLQYSTDGGITWLDFNDGYYRRSVIGGYAATLDDLPDSDFFLGAIDPITNVARRNGLRPGVINWFVSTSTNTLNGITKKIKVVRSLVPDTNRFLNSIKPIEIPAGVENWIFRNKITLAQ
jgi:hypothetical protein